VERSWTSHVNHLTSTTITSSVSCPLRSHMSRQVPQGLRKAQLCRNAADRSLSHVVISFDARQWDDLELMLMASACGS
jgi:hypothetical protein